LYPNVNAFKIKSIRYILMDKIINVILPLKRGGGGGYAPGEYALHFWENIINK
jgi:hypothetical protein